MVRRDKLSQLELSSLRGFVNRSSQDRVPEAAVARSRASRYEPARQQRAEARRSLWQARTTSDRKLASHQATAYYLIREFCHLIGDICQPLRRRYFEEFLLLLLTGSTLKTPAHRGYKKL